MSGGSTQFVQSAVVNYVQQQGAGYIGKLVADGVVKEGSPDHTSLHAIVACAGAAASSQSCGAGAMGAAASSLLTNLFTDDATETNANKEAKRNVVTSLVAGVAAVISSSNAATATTAATAALDNNWLTPKQKIDRDQKLANCTTDTCRKEVRDQFAKLWQSNHDRAEKCSTDQACLAVVEELRGVQRETEQRIAELQGQLQTTGTLTADQAKELYALQNSDRSIMTMTTTALGKAVSLGGPKVLQEQQASTLIAEVGVAAAPALGSGLAGAIGPKKASQESSNSQLTESSSGDRALASLNAPATRHYADKVTQSSVGKEVNTVVDRSSVDLSADVAIIRSGQAQRLGDTFVVNGRTYGMHNGTLYPMSGPGLYTLDRGSYKALGVLNKFGDTPKAYMILRNMGVSAETKATALEVFKAIKK